LDALGEMLRATPLARLLARLDLAGKRDLLALFGQSAGDWLDGWFESDPIKAVLGFDAIVGNYASPYSAGTAYVLLHHAIGEVNGKKGTWGHAVGGMGAITQAMAASCAKLGVEMRTNTPVREILVEKGRAVGAVTETGETVRGRAVISNLNPKLLFQSLVDPALLPADFRERMARYRCASGTFRMNVALAELPRFSCLPEPGDHLTAGIVMAPSLAYMERAYADAREYGWSKAPIVELLIPSFVDDTLAPPGKHVASLFCQHVAPELPDGKSWNAHRDDVADLMLETVERFAPGFKASVIARTAMSPLDLEREFGLVGGDIAHGTLQSHRRTLHVRCGHASGRRRQRHAGPQRGACGDAGHPQIAAHAAALDLVAPARKQQIDVCAARAEIMRLRPSRLAR
jgi:phytoene dehydrogenase-like protein